MTHIHGWENSPFRGKSHLLIGPENLVERTPCGAKFYRLPDMTERRADRFGLLKDAPGNACRRCLRWEEERGESK